MKPLDGLNSDRYQYILPYYDFSKNLFTDFFPGTINFSSSGDNNLKNTNNLRSKITNNLNFMSLDNYLKSGFKNNFNLYLKNLNTVGKNDSEYKASPQVELMSIFELKSTLPLLKKSKNFDELITPTMSLRINPSDMKNYSTSSRLITADNIFDINRLGLSDTFETGRSLTLGLDYKKEKFDVESNTNSYFEIKLASTFRDKFEKDIPKMSAINTKNSNLFGSVKNNLNDIFKFNYQFSIDNNFEKLEHSSLNSELSLGAFSTGVEFIEQNGNVGNSNSIKNYLTYKFDENNFISFETRRNRKINLTEYYDLIYEYKNDCLTAGLNIKRLFTKIEIYYQTKT
jgi:LPS-assembly protein